MKIAKIAHGEVVAIDDSATMFPNTSFPVGGPSSAYLDAHQCVVVRDTRRTVAGQALISCAPYLEDGIVYTVRVVDIEIEQQRLALIQSVKAEAGRIILSRYSVTAQLNIALALSVLNLTKVTELTDEGMAELEANLAAMAWINSVREASNQIEADIQNASTMEELTAMDWSMRWPV